MTLMLSNLAWTLMTKLSNTWTETTESNLSVHGIQQELQNEPPHCNGLWTLVIKFRCHLDGHTSFWCLSGNDISGHIEQIDKEWAQDPENEKTSSTRWLKWFRRYTSAPIFAYKTEGPLCLLLDEEKCNYRSHYHLVIEDNFNIDLLKSMEHLVKSKTWVDSFILIIFWARRHVVRALRQPQFRKWQANTKEISLLIQGGHPDQLPTNPVVLKNKYRSYSYK